VPEVTGLSAIRSKMKTRGRLLLSVFVIAWMSAALQPCLMAMELLPTESASISEVAVQDSHGGHSAIEVDHEHPACPHCPPSKSHDSNSCAVTSMNDCDILPEVKPGERILKVDISDAFGDAHSNYHYYGLDRSAPELAVISADRLRPTFIVGPSLYIRNCVFLK
jgi:hypothetical protein